jgi:outer membrane scaffolding protein for murein synthesis (MipA/OmpV family)
MRKLFSLSLLSLFGLMCSSMAYAENFYTFGLGAGVAPRYIGGKDYSGHIMPVLSAEFSNGLLIRAC